MVDAVHPEPGETLTLSGQQLIFRLFVVLAIATAVTLLFFAQLVDPQYRTRIYIALAGDLAAPVVAWYVIKAIHRRQARRAAQASPPPR